MATNEKWEIAIGLSDYVWHRKEENKEGNEAVFQRTYRDLIELSQSYYPVALPLFDMNFRAKKEITDSFLL